MRKPYRQQSRVMNLPQSQRDTIIRWLLEDKLTYLQVIAKAKSEFSFKTTTTALSHFYSQHCSALVLQQQAAKAAAEIKAKSVLEIIVDVTTPQVVRLQIIPGTGVKVEGAPPS